VGSLNDVLCRPRDEPQTEHCANRRNELVIDNAEPSDLSVTIRFMDADGNHWLRSLDSVKLAKRR
jgi:hypothetical protein